MNMKWEVIFHEDFDKEFEAFDERLQDEILAHAILLRDFGPTLGRPTVDTLKASAHAIIDRERRKVMARNLEQVLAKLPPKRREQIERRAGDLATLKGLRQVAKRTQEDLASSLGVGQDTISRLEHRSDMLISTLKRYIEAMGGQLDLIARFPNRPPVMIDPIAEPAPGRRTAQRKSSVFQQRRSIKP